MVTVSASKMAAQNSKVGFDYLTLAQKEQTSQHSFCPLQPQWLRMHAGQHHSTVENGSTQIQYKMAKSKSV
jgi:hypothetical protein